MPGQSLTDLLKGEISMTVGIVSGLLVGELVIRLRIAEALIKNFLPFMRAMGLGPLLGAALAVSVGSSKAAATLLARGMEESKISRDGAIWGTVSLSFPAYLRRWPSTLALCTSMAGTAGGIFAVTLLLRSMGRFFFAVFKTRGSERDFGPMDVRETGRMSPSFWLKRLAATLPVAWIFYAAAFWVIPRLEMFLKENLGGSILPVAGWSVASAALAGISASLALARGALDAGEISTAQAVFALLLGNGIGYFTRALRQNAGYFFGIFPADVSKSIFAWNVATMLPFIVLSLVIAAVFLY
ncbi:MAG: hypothetical protein LBS00_07950 [Synergistaceae bacterium]|jgi:hypothetical protein|nr:hypothetical protein [Synergistaceae bacterium]